MATAANYVHSNLRLTNPICLLQRVSAALCNVAAGCDAVCAAKVLVPHCVEPPLLVSALVGVGAKEVTLGLQDSTTTGQQQHNTNSIQQQLA